MRDAIALVVTLLLVAGSGVGLVRGAEPPAPGGDARKSPPKVSRDSSGSKTPWLGLDDGLRRLRKEYLPAIVVYELPAPAAPPTVEKAGPDPAPAAKEGARPRPTAKAKESPASLVEYLGDRSLSKVLRQFVCIRIQADDLERPYPPLPPRKGAEKDGVAPAGGDEKGKEEAEGGGVPPEKEGAPGGGAPAEKGGEAEPAAPAAEGAGARLGLVRDKPSIVVISFREEVVLRYEDEIPTRTRMAKDLARVVAVNKLYADQARKVELAMERSRYAARLGNQREAVLCVRDLEAQPEQLKMDPLVKEELVRLIAGYRAAARKEMAAADKLETSRKYTEAIGAYDKVMEKFPFQDILQQSSKRKGEILRKMTYGF